MTENEYEYEYESEYDMSTVGYKPVEWLDVPVAKNRTGTKRVKGLFPHSVHHTREIYSQASIFKRKAISGKDRSIN
jgi:hypothetical protein